MKSWQRQLSDSLQQRGLLTDVGCQRLATGPVTPWYMVMLVSLAAWFSALLMTGALLVLFNDMAPAELLVWSLLTLGLAVWLFRRSGEFVAQLALACSLIGQVLLVVAVMNWMDGAVYSWRLAALIWSLVAALMLLPQASAVHRLLCALLIMAGGVQLAASGGWLGWYSVALAALAVVLWLSRERWAGVRAAAIIRALASAATLGALVVGLFVHTQVWGIFSSYSQLAWLSKWYPAAAGALLLASSTWLLRDATLLLRCCAAAVVLGGAVLCAQTPGLLVGAALWLAVFNACERHWSVVVGIGTTAYLGVLYYSLHITLLNKSLLLMATGVALLLARWLLLRLWKEL